jgi:hypothetical protein
MMSTKALLGLALTAYLFFLLWQLPAQYAQPLLPMAEAPIAALPGPGVYGSWQQGGVGPCQVGPLRLTALEWRFKPWALITCRLASTLSLRTATSAMAATISRGWGTVAMMDVEGEWAAAEFASLLSPLGVSLGGVLSPTLERIVIRQGRIVEALGTLSWQGATMVLPWAVELGDLSLALSTSNAGVLATIKDTGGPLQIHGNMLLKADGSYTLAATLTARQPARQGDLDRIALLGQQQANGQLQLAYSGVMPLLPL